MTQFPISADARNIFAAMDDILDLWCTPKVHFDFFRNELVMGVLTSDLSDDQLYVELRGAFLTGFEVSDAQYAPTFIGGKRLDAAREFARTVKEHRTLDLKVVQAEGAFRAAGAVLPA